MSQSAHLFRLIDECDQALDELWEERQHGPYYVRGRATKAMEMIQDRRDELALQLEAFLRAERRVTEIMATAPPLPGVNVPAERTEGGDAIDNDGS